ncbi:MAG: amidohydrolase family protein [Thermodesulfovibrionales bacterium]|nr:amidohydrolase family protein [Thermodesulfovibrionales bacterium]
MLLLFKNCNLLDIKGGEIQPNSDVLIENSEIKEVKSGPITIKNSDVIVYNLQGKTVMPGLCDAHVHITAIGLDLNKSLKLPPSYITAHSLKIGEEMLRRGFTTVRDAGGADWGLAMAIKEGVFQCPRLLYCGHALSQTGGHGDLRFRGEDFIENRYPSIGSLGRICDGVTEVRKAVRDELRKGATHIKIMVSGGIVSPTDDIHNIQFSIEEIKAAVEEAENANTYVMAHAYTAASIKRALHCGVRSIEHGNLIDEETLDLLIEKNAFLVPTLATYETLYIKDGGFQFPKALIEKAGDLREKSLISLEKAYKKGAKIAFGTDLLGPFHKYQLIEFRLRREIMPPIDIIRSATINCAELFNLQGKIGVIEPGAYADLLVIDGNPLENIEVLMPEKNKIKAILKEGKFIINEL